MDDIIDIKTRKPLSQVKSFDFERNFEGASGLWDAEYNAVMDNMTLKSLFFSEPWPFIALDLVADSISSSPMVVKRKVVGKDGSVNIEIVDDHQALFMLQSPNPLQTYAQFIYNLEVEIDLMGNGIIYYARANKQLYIIPAETVTLEFNNKGELEGYRVHEELTGGVLDTSKSKVFKERDIWHYRRPNPKSLYWGLSPFVPNRKPILLNRYSLDWVTSFYLKGATPNVVLSTDKGTNEKAALRFLKTFEMAHTGRSNYRRPLVLPSGMKAEVLNQSIADQNFVELVKLNRQDILQILRIPPHAVGLAEAGSLGSEEHKESMKFFFTGSITPRQEKISQFLTGCFRENLILAEDEYLDFDNSNVLVLKDDLLKQAKLAESLRTVWSLAEIRSEIFDMEPLADGETTADTSADPTIEASPVPSSNDNEALEQIEEDEDDDLSQSKEYREGVTKAIMEKFSGAIVKGLEDQVSLLENESKFLEPYIESLLIKWQAEAALIVLRELKKGQPKTKTVGDDETPKKIPSKKRLRRLITRLLEEDLETYVETVELALATLPGQGFDTLISTIVNGENISALEAIKLESGEKIRKTMKARSLESFKNISQTTTNQIIDRVEAGIKEGKGLRQIGSQIANEFDIPKSRATTIARTEALTANSIGQKAGMEAAKEVVPDLVKVWVTASDSRVRGNPGGLYPKAKDNHWKLGGEVQEIDDLYSNNLDYPRDPKGEAYQTINCRCTQVVASKRDITSDDIESFRN